MQINLIYDSSVNAAPAGFVTAINTAAQYLDSLLTDPITANILVGWGEDDNGTYSIGNAVAIGGPLAGIEVTYSQLKADLTAAYASSGSSADATALQNLPAQDPTPGGQFYVTSAQEKAWGLIPANGTGIDGAIGFNSSSFIFDFNPNNRAMAGEIDAIGVAEHELTHALGRVAFSSPSGFGLFGDGPFSVFRAWPNPVEQHRQCLLFNRWRQDQSEQL